MSVAVLRWTGVKLHGVDSVFAPTDARISEVSFLSRERPVEIAARIEEKHHRIASNVKHLYDLQRHIKCYD